jgi:hypothetical protein
LAFFFTVKRNNYLVWIGGKLYKLAMERDFLGLGSKNNPVTIKEEATDTPPKDSGMLASFHLSFH